MVIILKVAAFWFYTLRFFFWLRIVIEELRLWNLSSSFAKQKAFGFLCFVLSVKYRFHRRWFFIIRGLWFISNQNFINWVVVILINWCIWHIFKILYHVIKVWLTSWLFSWFSEFMLTGSIGLLRMYLSCASPVWWDHRGLIYRCFITFFTFFVFFECFYLRFVKVSYYLFLRRFKVQHLLWDIWCQLSWTKLL